MPVVTEARAHARHPMVPGRTEGIFLLKANQRQYRFDRIHDLSPSGTGIHLPVALPVGSPVTLTFTADDWHVTIAGRVVWSDSRGENIPRAPDPVRYRHGIHFERSEDDDVTLFFLTLRKYLDDL